MELRQIAEKYNTLLDQSANVADLIKENEGLQAENDRLNEEAGYLQQGIAHLRRTEMIWLFVAGAGVFFVGLLVSKVSKKKRYYFDV